MRDLEGDEVEMERNGIETYGGTMGWLDNDFPLKKFALRGMKELVEHAAVIRAWSDSRGAKVVFLKQYLT